MPPRILATLTCLALIPAAFAQDNPADKKPAEDTTTPLTVTYTGRTLGYLRFPDQQSTSFTDCSTGAKKNALAEQALTFLKPETNRPELLLGVGDNFAPDLYSRVFSDPNQPSAFKPAKDLYTWDFVSPHHEWKRDTAGHDNLNDRIESGNGIIPADNVGCFLKYAAFDAIVPGKHDFYFGPERLRMLARFLMTSSAAPAFQPVRMLAANLAIVTTQSEAYPRIPTYQIQEELDRRFDKTNETKFSIFIPPSVEIPFFQADLPDTVLPWKREFVIKDALDLFDAQGNRSFLAEFVEPKTLLPAGFRLVEREIRITQQGDAVGKILKTKPKFDEVRLCETSRRNPYAFEITKNCVKLIEEPLPPPTKPKPATTATDIAFSTGREVLTPNSNWAICFKTAPLYTASTKAKKDRPYYCQTFSVHAPFFQYDTKNLPDGIIEPEPYLLKDLNKDPSKDDRHRHVAIFGVVDPDVINNIGRLNYGWLNKDKKSETTVEAIDPAVALQQLFDKCNADPNCKSARKVLLAQMPEFKASQLVASMEFNFDLVIAQTDPAHETGNTSITRTTDPDSARAAEKKPFFIVTPGALYDSSQPNRIDFRMQTATVTRPAPAILPVASAPDPPCCKGKWILENNTKETGVAKPPTPVQTHSLREVATTAIRAIDQDLRPTPKKPSYETSWSTEQILQRLALLAMQKVHHADVALIQSRDLFQPNIIGLESVGPDNLQELLDRIFWKGDYSVSVSVTGATIKSILAQGKVFDKADLTSLSTDLSKGRGLVPLGAFTEGATQNLIIKGLPEQDPAQYGLALTDFLAIGDTGYPDLQKPTVPPAYRLKDFPNLYSVSGLVCHEIATWVSNLNGARCAPLEAPTSPKKGPDPLVSRTYLDRSNQMPFDPTKGYTPFRQTIAWLIPSLHYHDQLNLYAGVNAAEYASHQRPLWYVTLEKADFALTLNAHQNISGNLKGTSNDPNLLFSGVSVPQATAPNSSSITFNNRTRLLRASRTFDFFLVDDLSFAGQKTQKCGSTSNPNCNYTKSLSANTLSFESGLLPYLHPRQRESADLKLLISGRVDTQLDSPPLVIGLADKSTLSGKLNHSFTLLGKLGLRLEDERSWIETGFELGERLRVPSAIMFSGGRTCPLGVGQMTPPPPPPPGAMPPATPPPTPKPIDDSFLDCVAYYSSPTAMTDGATPLITKADTFSARTANRPAQGVFLNYSLNIPLPWQKPFTKPVAFLSENKGDIFFNRSGDFSTDTRYFDKWANSLVIPVLGNFTLKPEIDVFFFQNKIGGTSYHVIQTMVTFGYQFAWHQGLPWWKTLQYANPAQTTSLPTGGR